MRNRWIWGSIAVLLSFLFMLATWALPGTTQNYLSSWQVVGQVGGPTQAIAVQGNYAYVGVGLRLVVLDVSNAAVLQEVGATQPFPYFVEGVVVSGTLAYVAAGGAGLRVVDVSDPAHPTEVGAWDSPGYAEGVAVAGSNVYLADGPYGLRVVDVSDPAHPTEVGFAYPMNYAFEVAVAERYAYVAAAGAGLLVVDVSDPAHLVEVGSLDTPGYAYGVAVASNTVYVADGWEGLRIVNVVDPARPVQVGCYKTSGWAFGVAVSGTLVYVADAFKGLQVVDVSDPVHSIEVGGYEVSGGHAGNVAVAGNVAYVADRNWGLRAVDVSNPAHPAQVGFYSPLGYARDVAVAGNYAYVAAATYGLRVVDISDPAHPVQVGVCSTPGHREGGAISVAVAGNYAYVCGHYGLYVVNISNPTHPTQMGFREGGCRDMAVAGGIAYLANELGLELVSLADPRHPTCLGLIELADPTWPAWGSCTVGVAVSGNLAYVAVEHAGLKIVDVSDPPNPKLIGVTSHFGEDFAQEVAVTGDYSYVTTGRGLRVVDVSDPTCPAIVGSYDTPGEGCGIVVFGDTAYVSDGGGGLQVVDVSDPSNPVLAGSYNTPGYAHKVTVVGKHVYIGDGDGGMLILEMMLNSGTVHNQSMSGPEVAKGPGGWITPSSTQFAVLPNAAGSYLAHSATGGQRNSLSDYQPREHDAKVSLIHHPNSYSGLDVGSTLHTSSGISIVTSADDSGPGSLRWCLENAVNGDTITFDPDVFPPSSPVTIALASELPWLTQGNITIDASNAGVILDGSGTSEGTNGLIITSDGNVIQGLQILRFPYWGVVIQGGGKNNIVGGDRTVGTGPMGQGNLISGSRDANLGIFRTGSDYNVITGNLIGTDPTGTFALHPTANSGVSVQGGAQRNVIGPGNVISGNNIGVGVDSENNIIIGNLIGTDISGLVAIGNSREGIGLGAGAQQNRIGGRTPAERNIISGNGAGIYVEKGRNNVIVGNFIGVDATGMHALGNQGDGIMIRASDNRVGGKDAGERNIISGNGNHGVSLALADSNDNSVIGNYIGTDVSGTVDLGNEGHGVSIELGAFNNLIERNLISGNNREGVLIYDWGSSYNAVIGNLIGTDVSGTLPIANWCGVGIGGGASFNRVGGTTAEESNIISGNGIGIGIGIGRTGDVVNLVMGNFIGTDISGTSALGNAGDGVSLGNTRVFIGGMTEGERNVISGNGGYGIHLPDSGADYSWITGNYIGTDASGTVAMGNQYDGIGIYNGEHNIMQNNTIAYNTEAGVSVGSSAYNTIRRNSIHSHLGQGIVLSNEGNKALPAPLITSITSTSVSGTACPGCTVEVFSDAEDEGRVYEGSTIADASGAFTFYKEGPLIGPNITATATDSDGNTSEFSTP